MINAVDLLVAFVVIGLSLTALSRIQRRVNV